MLFTSFDYLFYFLPSVFLIFWLIRFSNKTYLALSFLVVASIFFYAWWDYRFLILLIASILGNFYLGKKIIGSGKNYYLLLGLTLNLAAICYFKYLNFTIDSLNLFFGLSLSLPEITLPLAISFFTFQQIAYLADCYIYQKCEHNLVDYSLFVSFFPQLIAGPIVHHSEMLPQFRQRKAVAESSNDVAIGVGLITIGLVKKLLIADQVAIFADSVFSAANTDIVLSYTEAWCGALAYTFQIYFDFSGYTDMAMGSARLFGIRLPINFNSPYKATNPSDFWAKWHITLSRFLRDYLYVPLGGSRKGYSRTAFNLTLTMLLGGLWHGANWTFVAWGGIHGLFLVSFHLLKGIAVRFSFYRIKPFVFIQNAVAMPVTFLMVTVAWVFFRSDSFNAAKSIFDSMFFVNGFYFPDAFSWFNHSSQNYPLFLNGIIGDPTSCLMWLVVLSVIVFFCPNSIQLSSYYELHLEDSNKSVEKREQIGSVSVSGEHWVKTYLAYPILGFLILVTVLFLYMKPDNSPFIYTIF